jgi:pimeloyl-ACP methyl ester carboxylesterase
MDLAFQWALGMAKTGGFDSGELFFVASRIEDGDPRSWSGEFETYGDAQRALADRWASAGQTQNAAEARMKAYASFRWAWRFSTPDEGDRFAALIGQHEVAFAQSVHEQGLPVEFLEIPFGGSTLPGLRLAGRSNAPTLLVIGGDTGREDLFHLIGLGAWQRGFTSVMVDLPGQGSTPLRGLHFATDTERPVSAIVDFLMASYDQDPRSLAAIGFGSGGYAVCRALGFERRIAAGAASTPIGEMAAVVPPDAIRHSARRGAMTSNLQIDLWRAGLKTAEALIERLNQSSADPGDVRCPFLSIAGTGDAPRLIAESRRWHEALAVPEKRFIVLDAESGADAHCQINNPTRLRQEVCAWLDGLFADGRHSGDPHTSRYLRRRT